MATKKQSINDLMPDEVAKTVAAIQISLVQINRYAINRGKEKKGKDAVLKALKSLSVTVEEVAQGCGHEV